MSIKYHEDNDIVINKSNIILMIKHNHTNPIKNTIIILKSSCNVKVGQNAIILSNSE